MRSLILFVSVLVVSLQGFAVEKKVVTRPTSSPSTYTMNTQTMHYSSFEHEIQASFTGGSYTTTRVGNANVSILSAQASWAKFIKSKIQVGGEGSFTSTSGGASSTSFFDLMGFGTYNLDDNTRESIYAKAGLGLFAVPNTSNGYDNKFGFMVGGGKRFALWERVQYSPEVRLIKKGDLDMFLNIYFLNLSIMY